MNKTLSLTVVILAFVSSSISYAETRQDPKKKPEAWTQRMRALNKVLSELLPDITSDARFNDPGRRKRIEKNATELAGFAHDMKGPTPPDADPSIALIADLFDSEAQRAARELKRGNRAYARSILRTVPGFCIGCHTRTIGPESSSAAFQIMPKEPFASKLDEAEFFVATRRFDAALDDFERIIGDPAAAQGRQLEWERAVRHALAVSVRVKRDPVRARSIVERVIAAPNAPQFLKEDAVKWLDSVKDWQAEPTRQAVTEEGLYAEAARLAAKAREMQKYPADRAADIVYFRLSATVHDLLRQYPQGSHAAEGLMLLGVSYEALRDLDLWTLHELYYAGCIQKAPHTATAQICYRLYEQSVYAGYSGSGGLSLPQDAKGQLDRLKALAIPEPAKTR